LLGGPTSATKEATSSRGPCGASSSARSETRIGRALIGSEIHDGATVTLDAAEGELTVQWTNPAGAEPEPQAEPVGAAA